MDSTGFSNALSDKSIKNDIAADRIFKRDPSGAVLNPDKFIVKSSSVDLTIGRIYEPTDGKVRNAKQLAELETQNVKLQPGDTLLIEVHERFALANDIGGILFPPNTLSKEGVIMTNPGHIDPGYKGIITICLVNMGKSDVPLSVGKVIGRLLLVKVDKESDGYIGNEVVSVAPEHLNKLGRDFAGISKRLPTLIGNALFKWMGITLPVIAVCLALLALVIPEISKYRVESKTQDLIAAELIEPLKADIDKNMKLTASGIISDIQILKTEIAVLKRENELLKAEVNKKYQTVKGQTK